MEHDFHRRLALGRRQRAVLTQPVVNVLHIHYRVVDKRAYGDRYAAETHGVDGITHEMEDKYGDYYRHRERHNGYDGGADIHQEEEQHYDDEEGTLEQSPLQIAYRRVDKFALAEDVAVDLHVGRQRAGYVGQLGVDALRKADSTDGRLFGDSDEDGRLLFH